MHVKECVRKHSMRFSDCPVMDICKMLYVILPTWIELKPSFNLCHLNVTHFVLNFFYTTYVLYVNILTHTHINIYIQNK